MFDNRNSYLQICSTGCLQGHSTAPLLNEKIIYGLLHCLAQRPFTQSRTRHPAVSSAHQYVRLYKKTCWMLACYICELVTLNIILTNTQHERHRHNTQPQARILTIGHRPQTWLLPGLKLSNYHFGNRISSKCFRASIFDASNFL